MTDKKHTKEPWDEFDGWFNNLLFSYEKTQSCFFRDVIRANKLNMQKEYLRLCKGGKEELNSVVTLEAEVKNLRRERDELREALQFWLPNSIPFPNPDNDEACKRCNQRWEEHLTLLTKTKESV